MSSRGGCRKLSTWSAGATPLPACPSAPCASAGSFRLTTLSHGPIGRRQGTGHDTLYPSLDIVNEALGTREDLYRLAREAKAKYDTIISCKTTADNFVTICLCTCIANVNLASVAAFRSHQHGRGVRQLLGVQTRRRVGRAELCERAAEQRRQRSHARPQPRRHRL